MNRRVKAGLMVIRWVGLGAMVFAPRMAFALARPVTCSSKLEGCTDSAINDYENCTCYVDNGDDLGCYTVTVPNNPPTSIAGCVSALQGEVFKCQAADILCTLTSGRPGAPALK